MALEAALDATVDGDVELAVTVRNAGDEPVDLQFPTGQRVEVVAREPGREVWRWSEGRVFAQAEQTVSLGPGEAMAEVVTWREPAEGTYEVVAEVVGDAGVRVVGRVEV